jgi:predicted RNase H-like nuclease
MKLRWLRSDNEDERLAEAAADALVRDQNAAAYWEARRRERDVILGDGTTHQGRTPAHCRRVALIAAKRTGRAVQLDTGTWTLAGRD